MPWSAEVEQGEESGGAGLFTALSGNWMGEGAEMRDWRGKQNGGGQRVWVLLLTTTYLVWAKVEWLP